MNRLHRGLAIALTLTALLSSAPSVFAAPPVRDVIFYDSFVADWICDFPIVVSFGDPIRDTVFMDGSGKPTRELQHFANFTVTFTANGNVLTTKGPAHVTIRFAADGSVESVEQDGMSANITLPGQGRVWFDVGRIVWDGDGNIVEEKGLHQAFGTAPSPEFCAAMA